jgi:hypothetical protein
MAKGNGAVGDFPALGATRCHKGYRRRNLLVERLGEHVRKNPFISLFAASLIAFLPASAAMAQTGAEAAGRGEAVSVRDRPRPEYDAQGARLGSFDFNASIDFGVTSTDNLFLSRPELEVDQVYYEVTPSASLSSDWSRHALTIDGAWTARRHDGREREDTDAHHLRASGRLDIGTNTALQGNLRTAHQVTPRTDPDVSDTSSVPVEYDRLDAALGLSHRFARFDVRLDAGNSDYEYDGAQNFRDFDETFYRGRIEATLSPRIGLVLQGAVDERNYSNTPTLSSEGSRILAGVALSGDLVRGELLLGQFERDYNDPAVGKVDGLAGAARIEWYVTPLTTVTFNARRDADDQVGATSRLPFVTTEYGARIDHELQRNFLVMAGGEIGHRDYDPSPRRDDYNRFEIGADYLLNRRAALSARFMRYELEYSRVSIDDRDVNTVTVGLSLRL